MDFYTIRHSLFAGVILLVVTLCAYGQTDKPSDNPAANQITYTLIDKEAIGPADRPVTAFKILLNVKELPHKSRLLEVATAVWKNGNTFWDKFVVFVFLPGMNTGDAAYYVAEFGPGGVTKNFTQEFALLGTRWADAAKNSGEIKNTLSLKSYKLSFDIEQTGTPHQIKISVQTNFPDSTIFSLMVRRPYYQQGKDKKYLAVLHDEQVNILGGQKEMTILFNDTSWFYECLERKRKFTGVDDFTGFKSISPNIEVTFAYFPNIQHSESVKKILGQYGENIDGGGMKKVNGSLCCSVTQTFVIAFEK